VRQKGFAPIIILLVIVALGLFGYFAFAKGYLSVNLPKPLASVIPSAIPSPSITPDPTANWKTYNNSSLGFEVKYPADFTTKVDSIPNNGVQVTFNNSKQKGILIIKRPNNNPASNKQYGSLEEFDPRIKNFMPILIGGNKAWDSGTYTTQGDTIQRDIVLLNGDSVWAIQDIQLEDHPNDTFNLMLSTFKFTE
jgi:hypothetical protein